MYNLAINVVTYQQNFAPLKALIYSLLSQKALDNKTPFREFKVYVGHDGPSKDGTREFIEGLGVEYPKMFYYYESPKRVNLWGHNLRQIALGVIDEPFVHFTNGDNLYFTPFAAAVNKVITESDPDVITNAISHSYFGFEKFDGKEFAPCQTDFANFTVKTEMVKQLKFKINEFAADAHLMIDFKQKFPNFKQAHIPNILAVHQ